MRIRWTKEKEEELRELYQSMTAEALAIHFGTTKYAIYQKCFKLGLSKEQPRTIHLTSEQTLWLKLNYPHMATEICAQYLGISHRSCVRFARKLGVSKTPQFMKESQAHASKKAKESNLKNGTYPPKGWYSPNLQKGHQYQFKPGHKSTKPTF